MQLYSFLYITQIYMSDTFFFSNTLRFLKCMDGSRWNVLHLEAWEETTEMQWIISETIVHEPEAHLANHLHIIIHARDYKISESYLHTCIIHSQDCIKNRF